VSRRSPRPPTSSPKIRPHIRAPLAAGAADEVRLDIGQPDIIVPSLGADRDRVAALVIRAVDQNADQAHRQFPEGDLGGAVSFASGFICKSQGFALISGEPPEKKTAAMLRRYCGNKCPKKCLDRPLGHSDKISPPPLGGLIHFDGL